MRTIADTHPIHNNYVRTNGGVPSRTRSRRACHFDDDNDDDNGRTANTKVIVGIVWYSMVKLRNSDVGERQRKDCVPTIETDLFIHILFRHFQYGGGGQVLLGLWWWRWVCERRMIDHAKKTDREREIVFRYLNVCV